MVELIKSKQDHVITKTLIRERQLDQSMLCFTRIYRDENGLFQKDLDSQEYSCIMTESKKKEDLQKRFNENLFSFIDYGGASVEHVGPHYGPMNGNEMLFISYKGRIAKEDLSIIIFDPTTKWSENITDFIINTSVIYFSMLPFPHRQINRANVVINIFLKKEPIHQTTYLYTSLIDSMYIFNY